MTTSNPSPWDIGTGVTGYAWLAPQPRAQLLLQHGYAEYSERFVESYSGLIPRLQAMGVSVFAFDIRGHGRSPGQPGVTDLEEAVRDHLTARRKLGAVPLPLFLIGHSMGGLVTAASVLDNPGDLDGVILSSPGFASPMRLTRLLVDGLARLKPDLGVAPPEHPKGLSRDPVQVRRFQTDARIYRGRISALLASSGLRLADRVRRRMSDWKAPVLLVHGDQDSFTRLALSSEFVRTVAATDKTLHVVEGGYHELLNDICAEEVFLVLKSWLEQRLDAAQGDAT